MTEIVISEFIVNPSLLLVDEVKELYNDSNYLLLKAFCRNKSAFHYVKTRIQKWLPIHFKWISSHCEDINFLRKNKDKIDYSEVCKNPCIKYIIDLLEENLDKLNWDELSKNTFAYPLLKKYPHNINWRLLCQNTSKEVIEMIEKYYIKFIHWLPLSANPSAIHLLKKYPNMIDKTSVNINPKAFEILKDNKELIDYKILCSNQSKEAMKMIEDNINHSDVSFELLSSNPYAIPILLKYPQKIDWYMAIDNKEIGQLFKVFPENLNILIKYVIKYPSVLPFIKDYLYDISPVKLAENPSIFKIDKENYTERKNLFQKIILKCY
jgi:hypothetical protein